MSQLYQNALVYRTDTQKIVRADFRVDGQRIVDMSDSLAVKSSDQIIDLRGLHVFPGFVDVHVHFREPGQSNKETISDGSLAAAHGGYTTVCPMPNLNPAPDSLEHLEVELDLIRRTAHIEVLPYATITQGRTGHGTCVDFAQLSPYVVGFSDDGCGVQESGTMLEAMRQCAALDKPIVAHCEVEALLDGGYIHAGEYAARHGHKGICSESEWLQVARDIGWVRQTGCPYHVCHVSTRESVALIREAQREGLPVSGETAPHYLLLTDADLQEDGRWKMNPPIRSLADQQALRTAIADGTLSCIATDHAPHSAIEKSKGLAHSAMGIVGLETSFGLLYHHLVKARLLSLEQLIERMAVGPRRRFKIEGGTEVGARADFTVIDLEKSYTIDSQHFLSKGKATPFEGWPATGEVVLTIAQGRCAYRAAHRNVPSHS